MNRCNTIDSAQALKPLPDNPQRQAHPLPSPMSLGAMLPLGAQLSQQVQQHRNAIRQIISGADPRCLVVLGPCSIHDEVAALDYARRLSALAAQVNDRLLLVMRAYLEKPRTAVGWKGMLLDPDRNGGDLAQGLLRSRRLLRALAELGQPLATEALSPFAMEYLGDLVSWSAIGARTTESQTHREMASGLDMPVGFKNATDGSIASAINAMRAASQPHHHMGLSADGAAAMVTTRGNADTHLVLRGGRGIRNYDAASVNAAVQALQQAAVSPAVMVDCSHDNAGKQAERQPGIALEVMAQRQAGQQQIIGLMLESFIAGGRQDDKTPLTYGCSITDPCISWEQTEQLIGQLYDMAT